jgi:F420-dependent oxidoreductase-like protein
MVTRFGLQIQSFTSFDTPPDKTPPGETAPDKVFDRIVELTTTAEESGFDSVWVMDHFLQIPVVGPPEEPMFEAYTLLGALAARTTSARLGALVTGVTYRNPALVAKQVTALDVISGGRAVLGIGAAWFDHEHRALGFDFPPLGERFERLEEALQICRAMFREDAPSFSGRHYRVDHAVNRPRPVQVGGPPILVGGSGERTTLRLVARYADACNIFGDPEIVARKLAVLDRHCEEVGRERTQVSRTRIGTMIIAHSETDARRVGDVHRAQRGLDEATYRSTATLGTPEMVVDEVGRLFDAGLDGLVFNFPPGTGPDTVALAGETLTGAFGRL